MLSVRQMLAVGTNAVPLKRCILLENCMDSAIIEDIIRACEPTTNGVKFSEGGAPPARKPELLGVIRKYGLNFAPQNKWLLLFSKADDATLAFSNMITRRLGNRLLEPVVTTTRAIRDFLPVNRLMDNPAHCVAFNGHPPGTSEDEYAELLRSFKLKKSLTTPPIRFEPDGKVCLVEFSSIGDAQRAVRTIHGSEHAFNTDKLHYLKARSMV